MGVPTGDPVGVSRGSGVGRVEWSLGFGLKAVVVGEGVAEKAATWGVAVCAGETAGVGEAIASGRQADRSRAGTDSRERRYMKDLSLLRGSGWEVSVYIVLVNGPVWIRVGLIIFQTLRIGVGFHLAVAMDRRALLGWLSMGLYELIVEVGLVRRAILWMLGCEGGMGFKLEF